MADVAMDVDQSEAIANFIAFTSADGDSARQMLEANDWNLENAVQLYFATHAADADAGGAAVGSGAPKTDEELARELAGAGGGAGPMDADFVRPADNVRTEALYEDDFGRVAVPSFRSEGQVLSAMGHAAPARGGRGAGGPAHPFLAGAGRVPDQVADPFRDFRGEAEGAGGAEGGGAGGGDGLADLFKAPLDIIFPGTFDMAKNQAVEKDQWLLVSIQSNHEFASHQLNRDTWGQDMVKDLVKESFVFWQVYDSSEEGAKVKTFYRLHTFPTTMVVDPITGQRMVFWDGFVDPEKLMEDLFPFLDKSPTDSGAAALSHTAAQKKARRDAEAAGGGGGASSGGSAVLAANANLSEDEQLAMAMAASMEDAGPPAESGPGSAAAGGSGEGAAAGGGAEAAKADAEADAREEAEADERIARVQALAPEPAGDDPASCRVAIRLPDGSREQRRFLTTSTIADVHTFCLSKVPEALGGRAFKVAPSHPGAEPFEDETASLADAGVANSMIVMRWAD